MQIGTSGLCGHGMERLTLGQQVKGAGHTGHKIDFVDSVETNKYIFSKFFTIG